jgi:uncharacterized membrane protein YwaF
MFYPPHLVALSVIVLFNLGLIGLGRSATPTVRRRIRYTLAVVLIVNEASWHVWNWGIGQWTIQTMLPLHLCSVMVFASAAMLVTQSYTLYELLYFLGIGAATQRPCSRLTWDYTAFPTIAFSRVSSRTG